MSITVHDNLQDQARRALTNKGVKEPCPRCKHTSFYILHVGASNVVTIVCQRCGFKFEHLFSILVQEESANDEEEM